MASITGRALVVGAGIAGMATAVRLRRAGWEPTIVERFPDRRTGGYFIGLYKEGREAAQRLGVYDRLHTRTPKPVRTWEVGLSGNRTRSVGLLERPGSPDAVLRGDIEEALWDALDGIAVRFGTTPVSIDEGPEAVVVGLREHATGVVTDETYDLVVGADGLRSTVRQLVFGAHDRFMKPMHRIICAFQLTEQVPDTSPREGLVLAEPRRALWVFPLEDMAPTALFTYQTDEVDAQFTRPPAEIVREVFGDLDGSPAVRHALGELDRATELLFDSVHQVEMPAWHTRRVLLTGDAAWCLTLYSGMGASLGLMGADVLGDMLERHPGDMLAALEAWEKEMRPVVRRQQFAARVKRHIFAPGNGLIGRIRSLLLRKAGKKAAAAESAALAAQSR
ncbi:FAD-dependent monooxygenase [Streptomyces fuscichromogenes]|uniref:FAD-dependent monooxygenase n=1 Tax=Streptomyces fuscichromogenes TaxID=1324013 RepID=UPI00382E386A